VKFLDGVLLFVLAAIWGASFIFMRLLVGELGPFVTALLRTMIAGVVLVAAFSALRLNMDWRRNLRHYLIVGAVNSALPFVLFSYAALHIPAAVSSVANALTPVWGAVFAALLLREPLTRRKAVGLSLGVAGVALIAFRGGAGGITSMETTVLPVLACVLASVSYGFSGSYIKRWASHIPSRAMTAASLLCAGLLLMPLALLNPPPAQEISAGIWLLAAAFSLLCSAVAYLIYFRLIATAGVTRTLSVTLLIPVFAFFWGYLFLDEVIGLVVIAGAVLVIAGTTIIAGSGVSAIRRPLPAEGDSISLKET
jgi:drug/metabolite transporter (DMT)-like permease